MPNNRRVPTIHKAATAGRGIAAPNPPKEDYRFRAGLIRIEPTGRIPTGIARASARRYPCFAIGLGQQPLCVFLSLQSPRFLLTITPAALTSISNARAATRYAFGAEILSTGRSNPLVLELPIVATAAASQSQDSQWGEARSTIDTYLTIYRHSSATGIHCEAHTANHCHGRLTGRINTRVAVAL